MFAFDEATDLTGSDSGTTAIVMSDRYNVGDVPNGGYQTALLARSLASTLDRPDLIGASVWFVDRCEAGPAELDFETIRRGVSTTTAQARLIQRGSERTRLIGAYGHRDHLAGPTWVDLQPPELPVPSRCMHLPPIAGVTPRIHEQLEVYLDPATAGWANGRPSGGAVLQGWVRFSDGRPTDIWSLLFFVDALPPALFDRVGIQSWLPTIELSVQLRSIPSPGRLRFRFQTRVVTDGVSEEDGVLWDSEGRVVALSRQMLRLRNGVRTSAAPLDR